MSSGLNFAGSNDSGLLRYELLAGEGSVGREGLLGVGRWSAGGEGVLLGARCALVLANEGPVGEVGDRVEATEDA